MCKILFIEIYLFLFWVRKFYFFFIVIIWFIFIIIVKFVYHQHHNIKQKDLRSMAVQVGKEKGTETMKECAFNDEDNHDYMIMIVMMMCRFEEKIMLFNDEVC